MADCTIVVSWRPLIEWIITGSQKQYQLPVSITVMTVCHNIIFQSADEIQEILRLWFRTGKQNLLRLWGESYKLSLPSIAYFYGRSVCQ
jgi:hypothetical protein